jgi:hypothetical protein
MLRRIFTHRLFAPSLMVAIFGLGALTVGFLIVGPGLGPWADVLLTSCFGWNAETRRYRLDSLVLTVLQPPLFATVVFFFYADELKAFLARRRGRLVAIVAPAVFVTLAGSLLATSEISASGVCIVGGLTRRSMVERQARGSRRSWGPGMTALGRPWPYLLRQLPRVLSSCPAPELRRGEGPATFMAVTPTERDDQPRWLWLPATGSSGAWPPRRMSRVRGR